MSPIRWRLLAAAATLFAAGVAAQSNHWAPVAAPKAEPRASFVAAFDPALLTTVEMPPADVAEIAAARAANLQARAKRLQVGVDVSARGVAEAGSGALAWHDVDGVRVARWQVVSEGAEALRVELAAAALPPGVQLRFAGSGDPETVYGPFVAGDFSGDTGTLWSPVLAGEAATIEVRVPRGVDGSGLALAIRGVSHLFANPLTDEASLRAKTTGSCSTDFICKAASDPALATVGKAVARMFFSDTGGSYVCTGTLLNPTDGSQTPYFYSAHHCFENPSPPYRTTAQIQAVANTLATYWFYDRTTCNTGVANPAAVQLTGGATLLYSSLNSDVLFLALKQPPPAGAVRAGWDAATLANGVALTGVHHPGGNLKAVSVGTMGGFQSGTGGSLPSGSFIVSNWTDGITEGGSSGSGIFTGSSATEYKLRGGLWGGPSQCGVNTSRYDYYSRLDQAYPAIRQWIDPPVATPTLTVTKSGAGNGTLTSAPAGINCGSTCSAAFTQNASVTLTATPASGSVFGSWGGACSGSGSCTVTMDSAKSVSASFLLVPSGTTLSVSKTGTGTGTVTSSQGGIDCGVTCSVPLSQGQVLTLNAAASAGSRFTGWSGACSGIQPCTLTMDATKAVTASFGTTPFPVEVDVSTTAIAFGGQSMGTTSPPTPVVVTNVGANTVVFSGIGTSGAQFAQAGDCTNIAPGMSCTLNVTFTPAVTGIALGQASPVAGQLTIPSNANGQPHLVALSGSAEKSLVSHYYRSILRRAPDAGGKAYWEAEAQRLVGLGIGVNEAWYAMAMLFYGSPEYASFNRGDAAFVTDLYNTFFNRTPDGGGLSYWNNEIVSGLPRGVALAAFMFSAEFRAFSQGIFGAATVRPEIDTVVDFYRGLLGRTPDSGGFAYWLQRFRAAQCGGQAAVLAEVEAISSAFANSPEYNARARSNSQFVGDLYNSFLRRGGDRGGVAFWINELVTGARTRDRERLDFLGSAEFQARVAAILAAPCLP